MRISYGNGGWVRVDGIGLPGPLYARFAKAPDKRWRIVEVYIDGQGEPLALTAIRRLPLDMLEVAILDESAHLESRSNQASPDLHRLAAHYATTWGSGTYAGEHCETCGSPLRGRRKAHLDGGIRALQHWVAESWYAQFPDSGIEQVPMPSPPPPPVTEAEDFPLLEAPQGSRITDDFLITVRRCYVLAVNKRLPPAPTVAELAKVSPRTAHKWFYMARRRGIMPPGTRGRAG